MIIYLRDVDHAPLDVMMRDVTSSINIPVKADIFTEKETKTKTEWFQVSLPAPRCVLITQQTSFSLCDETEWMSASLSLVPIALFPPNKHQKPTKDWSTPSNLRPDRCRAAAPLSGRQAKRQKVSNVSKGHHPPLPPYGMVQPMMYNNTKAPEGLRCRTRRDVLTIHKKRGF